MKVTEAMGRLQDAESNAAEAESLAREAKYATDDLRRDLKDFEPDPREGVLLAQMVDHLSGDAELLGWELERTIESARAYLRELR